MKKSKPCKLAVAADPNRGLDRQALIEKQPYRVPLTAPEVAVILGVAPGTVYAWAAQRRIPCLRLSSAAIRFRLEDVERFLEESRC